MLEICGFTTSIKQPWTRPWPHDLMTSWPHDLMTSGSDGTSHRCIRQGAGWSHGSARWWVRWDSKHMGHGSWDIIWYHGTALLQATKEATNWMVHGEISSTHPISRNHGISLDPSTSIAFDSAEKSNCLSTAMAHSGHSEQQVKMRPPLDSLLSHYHPRIHHGLVTIYM